MQKKHRPLALTLLVATAACLLASSSGCGAFAQLMYVIKGHKTPAIYDGLEEKTVAVVVLSNAAAWGADTMSYNVAKMVSMKLANNVKKISVIPQSNIERWMDENDWDQASFSEIGAGLDADMVLAVEIGSYTIHDGSTLYKGQSELTVSVHDVAKDMLVFSDGPKDYVFPRNGRPAIQTTDRQFESLYLSKLTDHVSKYFYDHDALDSVAEDAVMPF